MSRKLHENNMRSVACPGPLSTHKQSSRSRALPGCGVPGWVRDAGDATCEGTPTRRAAKARRCKRTYVWCAVRRGQVPAKWQPQNQSNKNTKPARILRAGPRQTKMRHTSTWSHRAVISKLWMPCAQQTLKKLQGLLPSGPHCHTY